MATGQPSPDGRLAWSQEARIFAMAEISRGACDGRRELGDGGSARPQDEADAGLLRWPGGVILWRRGSHLRMGDSLGRKKHAFSPWQKYLAVLVMADENWAMAEARARKTRLTPAFFAGLAGLFYGDGAAISGWATRLVARSTHFRHGRNISRCL